jgi:small basic protein
MRCAVYVGYWVLFSLFSWFVANLKSRRHVAATVVAAVLLVNLAMPVPAQAQGSLMTAVQAVLKLINGVIQTALNSIHDVRAAVRNFYQSVTWPIKLIAQARIGVLEMVEQYGHRMASILNLNLKSATLPVPQALESLIRDHRVDNFSSLGQAFANTYGAIPAAADASPEDRAMADMDDALVLDNLKTLKATDGAADLELQAADSMENAASQAAPGSAPLLTAAAAASSIRSQALTQKMLAAELRQEAAKMAHGNELRKRGATFTLQLRGVLGNLLEHN